MNQAGSSWLHIVPWGIRKLAVYLKDMYGNPPVIITENGKLLKSSQSWIRKQIFNINMAGMDEKNKPFVDMEKALEDDKRISFHRDYLSNLSAAIRF